VIFMDGIHVIPAMRDTLLADKVQTSDEALLEIYRKMRPGEPPTAEMARNLSQACSSIPNGTIFRPWGGSSLTRN